MEACGYQLVKVAYRGYDSSKTLQVMHDSAIEKRTSLKLEQETEEQKQELEDLKQARANQRALKEQELERTTKAHAEEMKRKDVIEELDRNKLKFDASLEQSQASHNSE